MMLMTGYQLYEPILKFVFSCVYGLLCTSTLGCMCQISVLIVKMKATGVLTSACCVPLCFQLCGILKV